MSENEDYEIEFYQNEMKSSLDAQTEKFKPEIKESQQSSFVTKSMLEFVNEFYDHIISCKDQNASITLNLGTKSFKLYVSKSELVKLFDTIIDKKQKDLAEIIEADEFRKNGEDVFGMVSFILPNMITNAKAMQKVGYKYMPLTYSMNDKNFATFMDPESAIEWLKTIKPKDMFEAMGQSETPSDFFKNLGLEFPGEQKEENQDTESSTEDKNNEET